MSHVLAAVPVMRALHDRVDTGLRWTQDHWAASTGAASALALLLGSAPQPSMALGLVAMGALALGLLAELALTSRAALEREHRLVDQSASLRLLAARLEDIARQDAVTGIANRRALMDDLTSEVNRASRYGRPLSVLMIDVDRFKAVNDTYGHQFGDAVLVSTAGTLQRTLRASDSVARYGGEEFVVILPETTIEAAAVAAEKLRRAVGAARVTLDERTAGVTISVGVAALDVTGEPASEAAARLIASADAAMYAAKRTGRNRVVTALEVTRAPA